MDQNQSPSVPIIDFAPFIKGTKEERQNLGKEMVKIMPEIGFMYVTNHGVPSEDLRVVFEKGQKFFALPESAKMEYVRSLDPRNNRGWEELGRNKAVQSVSPDEKAI